MAENLLSKPLTVPYVVTVAITRKESGTWKWAAFQYLVAYGVTLATYQTGTFLTHIF